MHNVCIYRCVKKAGLHDQPGSVCGHEHDLGNVFLLIRTTFLAAFLSTVHIRCAFSCKSAEGAGPSFASLFSGPSSLTSQ